MEGKGQVRIGGRDIDEVVRAEDAALLIHIIIFLIFNLAISYPLTFFPLDFARERGSADLLIPQII